MVGAPWNLFSSTMRLRVMVIQPGRKASPIITALRPIRVQVARPSMLAVPPTGVMAGAAGFQRLWMATGNQAGRMREVASPNQVGLAVLKGMDLTAAWTAARPCRIGASRNQAAGNSRSTLISSACFIACARS